VLCGKQLQSYMLQGSLNTKHNEHTGGGGKDGKIIMTLKMAWSRLLIDHKLP